MKIGLIDVDGHNFPNLALMKISAWHKNKGDTVEWWWSDMEYYDIVYKSKVFSDTYSTDTPDPWNCGLLVKGGTGYCITTVNGTEIFDKSKNTTLPPEMEEMIPDYSIYPQYPFAVAMTSRGCPRGCAFCHVASKEGKCSQKVANLDRFWTGQKQIESLDPNLLACKAKADLLQQYADSKARVNFSQGLDIRLMTDKDIDVLNKIKLYNLHFAWDNPKEDLREKFRMFAKNTNFTNDKRGDKGVVYCLTNFNSTMEENLYRVYTLRDLGFLPYIMIYNKPSAPKEVKQLARWVNNRFIWRTCKTFEEYKRGINDNINEKNYTLFEEEQK